MKYLHNKIVQVALILVVSAASGFCQDIPDFFDTQYEPYNFEFNGNGARALGMGNAYLGVSDDITAIGWNPAGLFKMESPIIGFTFTSLSAKGQFLSQKLNTTSLPLPSENLVLDQNGSFKALTSVNFLAPLRLKGHPFVGSIAYTRHSNEFQKQGYKFDFIDFVPIFNEAGTFLFTDTILGYVNTSTELRGGIEAINIGFGTRVYSDLAFGTSLNIYSGKVQRSSNSVAVAPGIPVNNFQHGFGLIYQNQFDSNSFSGFNVTMGLKLDGPKFDAGLVVRTPFSLNQKGEEVSVEIVDLNGVAFLTDTTFQIDLLTKYDIPLMVGFGLGLQMNEKWLLATDFEYRNFASSHIKIRQNLILVPGGSNVEEFTVLDSTEWQYSNVFIVRAGTEYKYESQIGTVALRAGLGYVPLPTPSVDSSGNRSTAVSYQASLGAGIHWSQIKLDIGYMYKSYNLEAQSFVSEEQAQNHFLNVSFTGYF